MEPVRRWGAPLLSVLAVAELGARLTVTSTAPALTPAVQYFVTGLSIHIAGTSASVNGEGAIAAFVLCLVGTLPLAFPRPAAAAVVITASSVLWLTFLQTLTVAGLIAQLLALYRLGRAGSGRGSQHLAVALAAPFLVLALAGSPASQARIIFVLLASLAPAAALAGVVQRREALARGAAEQVMAGTEFEHMARGERARIARELHDVVAHHISMVSVQAETARLTTPGMPELGARRLMEIGDTARAGLTEMRRLLGVLREDAAAASPEEPGGAGRRAERRPQPGLLQLNDLLDEAREASGTGIRLIISGPVARLGPGVELAAYRIVQEALTNSRRHAPGAAVDVELRYGGDALRLRVRDNGPGAPGESAAGGGHGLLGMRERAQAAGGTLRAGPAAGGGFLVEATLPVTARPAGAAA
ncbi:MAG: sensor histidine kinase [Streptosporangiaceae bacterium]|nr:sensor histidine kinase [Streptosporangiaceae bacterium]MBV9857345.1 sensor histidine kinase [Streptosporangiaceae bacterium]